MTYEEISERLNVSVPTLSKWANDGEKSWKDKRSALITNPKKLRQLFLAEAERVANGEQPTINADALLKLVKSADTVMSELSPNVIYTVLKECDLWISQSDPELAVMISDAHKRYILHKIEEED